MSDDLIRALEESDYHLANERERVAALRQEIADARATLGEGWLAGGVSLAEGIRRKTAELESAVRDSVAAEIQTSLDKSKALRQLLRAKYDAHDTERKACIAQLRALADTYQDGNASLEKAIALITARGHANGGTP